MHVCPECGESGPSAGFCPRDGTPLESAHEDPLLGQEVGAYRVARLIGVGGMGRVYKGVNAAIGSRVAIKVLSHDCASNKELIDRFFAEAKAVNVIRHENIVNVLNLDSLPDRRPFIIMEYLDGAPLSKVIANRKQLPLGSLARVIGEVLSALGAAHDKGVIHRDLKPDNIFVTPHGRAKVLDFGIAKLTGDQTGISAQTRDGSLMGTPHYMAPEQAQAGAIDPRTDIYACGVILFEGATGRTPFIAEALYDLLHMHVSATPPPPRSLRPDMPPAYEQVILKALAKDPAQRQQSAKELYRELVEATRALPEQAWDPVGEAESRMTVGMSAIPTPMGPPTPSAQHPSTAPDPAGPPAPRGQPHAARAQSAPAHWQGQPTPQGAGQALARQAVSPGPTRSKAPLIIGICAAAALAVIGVVLATQSGGDETTAASAGAADGTGDTSDTDTNDTDDDNTNDTNDTKPANAGDNGDAPVAEATDAGQPRHAVAGGNVVVGQGGPVIINGKAVNVPTWPPSNKDWPMDATGRGQRGTDNAEAFDVQGFLPRALELARKNFPDAKLARIDAQGVRPDGNAALDLSKDFTVLYRFVSEANSKRPADLPLGVEHKPTCMYYVMINAEFMMYYKLDGWKCDDPPLGTPRCSTKQVWKRAAKLGAPTRNAVATLGYWAHPKNKTRGRWYFTIGDTITKFINDDC